MVHRRHESARLHHRQEPIEFGPYGIFESSPIAVEPNFTAIRTRTQAAVDEARTTFGREPTAQELQVIRQTVYDVWAEAAGRTAG